MESILVLLHTDETGTALPRPALEAITAALALAQTNGAALTLAAFGPNASAALAATGASARLIAIDSPELAASRYATDLAAAEALARTAAPSLIITTATSRISRIAAGLAHRLGGVIDTHITQISSALVVSRWFYRQRVEASLTRTERPWIIALDAGTHTAFAPTGDAASVETIAFAAPASRTSTLGLRSPATDAQTIRPDAKMLFVAGAGWTKKQPDGQIHTDRAAQLILDLLQQTGASLGSSKSLVDQGGDGNSVLPFLTHMNQIGQTGATPRHAKGLSTCCHGEEPHVVGWRFINDRRAISLDPNCGWTRGKADVVYIADAFAVVQSLNEKLK